MPGAPEAEYSEVLSLDLRRRAESGRPIARRNRVRLGAVKQSFEAALAAYHARPRAPKIRERGPGNSTASSATTDVAELDSAGLQAPETPRPRRRRPECHGRFRVICAITSCTNTSNRRCWSPRAVAKEGGRTRVSAHRG